MVHFRSLLECFSSLFEWFSSFRKSFAAWKRFPKASAFEEHRERLERWTDNSEAGRIDQKVGKENLESSSALLDLLSDVALPGDLLDIADSMLAIIETLNLRVYIVLHCKLCWPLSRSLSLSISLSLASSARESQVLGKSSKNETKKEPNIEPTFYWKTPALRVKDGVKNQEVKSFENEELGKSLGRAKKHTAFRRSQIEQNRENCSSVL